MGFDGSSSNDSDPQDGFITITMANLFATTGVLTDATF